MNRADLLLSCLRDGQPWSRRDIFERTGSYFLVNNAAVELRVRGLDVQWSRSGSLHLYQLVNGSLTEEGIGAGPQARLAVRRAGRGVARAHVAVSPSSVSDSLTHRGGGATLATGTSSGDRMLSIRERTGSVSDAPQSSALVPKPFSEDGSAALHPRPTGAEQLSLLVAAA